MSVLDDVEGHVSRLLENLIDEEPDTKTIAGVRRFFAREFGAEESDVEAGIGPDRKLYVKVTKVARGYINAAEIPIRFV